MGPKIGFSIAKSQETVAKMLKCSPAAPPEKNLQDSQKGAKQGGGDFLQEIVLISVLKLTFSIMFRVL